MPGARGLNPGGRAAASDAVAAAAAAAAAAAVANLACVLNAMCGLITIQPRKSCKPRCVVA
jgi:hypothetical protein